MSADLSNVYEARAVLTAERNAGREPDARLWEALDTAERYASGTAGEKELHDACHASADCAEKMVWRGPWSDDGARAVHAAWFVVTVAMVTP